MASNNNSFVLVMMLVVFAAVVQQCACQTSFTCASTGTPCILGGLAGNISNCCSSSCFSPPPVVEDVAFCNCSPHGGRCSRDADCCDAVRPAVRVCLNNRCGICTPEYGGCTQDSDCCPEHRCILILLQDHLFHFEMSLDAGNIYDVENEHDLSVGLAATCRKID